METSLQPILDLTPEELAAQMAELGMPKFRCKQIQEWIFQKRATSFEQMTNLSLADRKLLAEKFVIFTSTQARKQTATDGTEKVLLQWPQQAGKSEPPAALPVAIAPLLTETVMIPSDDDHCDDYGHTTIAHRRTACLSTQVGCPVQCAFCASGIEGLKTSLSAGQIIEQALRLTHALPAERRLTNIVFMGMGEPLANFDATVQAVRALMAPWGLHISGRKITVSTVGLPPQIKRLADLELPITLAISLHAPNDAVRKKIIPWANKIPLEKILEAARYYFDKTGREVTLEYIMLDGVNTLPEHARELATIAKSIRANVNLIYYNEVPELPFGRPAGQTMFAFQTILRGQHVNCHVRKSRGREIAAACGQLARQDKAERLKQFAVLGKEPV